MRHWNFWEWIAYGCLAVGALIVAADTGFRLSPDLMTRLPEFFHSGLWGFSPALLVVVATVILFLREFVFTGRRHVTPTLPPPPPHAAGPRKKADKIVIVPPPDNIPTEINPLHLMKLYEDLTTAEGDRLVSPFIGKLLRTSGRLDDMRIYQYGDQTPVYLASLRGYGKDLGLERVGLRFSEQWRDRVLALTHGQIISVVGKIRAISQFSVDLYDCELLDSTDLPSVTLQAPALPAPPERN